MNPAPVCPICGGSGSPPAPVIRIRGTDTEDWFSIERCRVCGVQRTVPVPDDLAPYYTTDLAATMTRDAGVLFARLRAIRIGREVRRLATGSASTVIDIGCGTGDLALAARRRGYAVVAADARPGRPSALRARPDIPYVRFDFETLRLEKPPLPGPYTFVLRHVLEHARDPVALLRALVQNAAQSFYIVVPNVDCAERRITGRNWYLWDPPRHLWHFDRDTLRRACEQAGLEVVAQGADTTSTLVPCVYRYLRLKGSRTSVCGWFGPTSFLAAALSPLSLLMPGNVSWLLARPADRPAPPAAQRASGSLR